ncbi:hypothetical protein GCM10009850_111250 [Nonomuraea monospora]|uniref:Uncharacterized protein n=1 Tax=Nonomuraea monospora TaxID=568818 RepID=A0ABP5PV96_9ACTN
MLGQPEDERRGADAGSHAERSRSPHTRTWRPAPDLADTNLALLMLQERLQEALVFAVFAEHLGSAITSDPRRDARMLTRVLTTHLRSPIHLL